MLKFPLRLDKIILKLVKIQFSSCTKIPPSPTTQDEYSLCSWAGQKFLLLSGVHASRVPGRRGASCPSLVRPLGPSHPSPVSILHWSLSLDTTAAPLTSSQMQAVLYICPDVNHMRCLLLSPFLLSGLGHHITLTGLQTRRRTPHDHAAAPSFPPGLHAFLFQSRASLLPVLSLLPFNTTFKQLKGHLWIHPCLNMWSVSANFSHAQPIHSELKQRKMTH